MKISASVKNTFEKNEILVTTNNNERSITIPSKTAGWGSSVNGGELLFLKLATCFCNDVYREAAKKNMDISSIEVNVCGEFGGEGDAASNIIYKAKINAPHHTQKEVNELIAYVDTVAEVHNTLRQGIHLAITNQ